MKKWKWAIVLISAAVIYLVAGAVLPFLSYQDLPDERQVLLDVEAQMEQYGHNDRAILLESAKEAWEYRLRLLHEAKQSVVLSTFDMREGESTSDIAALLLQRAQEGVEIKILVDGFSAQTHMEGREIFYALSSHPNIEIRLYNPVNPLLPWKSQGRLHDKYLIVDDQAYILGGRNTFDYFIGDYPGEHKSYDREVLLLAGEEKQSSITLVNRYFEQIWELDVCRPFHEEESLSEKKKVQQQITLLQQRYHTLLQQYPEYFTGYDYEAVSFRTEGIALLHNPTGIYAKEPVVFAQLAALMKQAGQSVVIHSPYAVLNQDMQKALQEVAERVPDASLMINSVANGDNVFASSDYLLRRQKVLDTGLTLYEYEGGTSYHGKSVLIDDDISIVGSYNLDLRSTYMDTELMLVIKSRELNSVLSGYMMEYEASSKKVIDQNTYEIPAGLTPQRLPLYKETLYRVIGFLMTPFRCVI